MRLAEERNAPLNVRVAIPTLDGIKLAVEMGMGVSLLPQRYVRSELRRKQLVAVPMPEIKWFQADDGTTIDMRTSGFYVDGMPEARLVVYMPATSADAAKIERLRVRARLRRVRDVSAAG